MATIGYLTLWGTQLFASLFLAGLSHAAHAYLSPYPTKLFDGDRLSDTLLNLAISPDFNPLGRYDEVGWWEFHSLRNYGLHALAWMTVVVIGGVLQWDQRAQVVTSTCARLASLEIEPVFCP